MGLLDDIGGQSGLLDFLRNNALNQNTNTAGLPSDQANYAAPFSLAPPMQTQMPGQPSPQQNPQPSPMDSAQWPVGPMGAPSTANAQVPQQPPAVITGAAQQAAAPAVASPAAAPGAPPGGAGAPFSLAGAGGGIGDRLMKGTKGFLGNLQNGPIGAIAGGLGALVTGQSTDPGSIAAEHSTATARALLSKGIPPETVQAAISNPELMKALITQTFGPQTVTSIGSGYVVDKNGKITRAYEPEDKIPAGFAKGDDGTMHFIPGGPGDPAYARMLAQKSIDPNAVHVAGKGAELYKTDAQGNVSILHKNEDSAPEATLGDGTTKAMAAQYLAGDKSVMQNLGRGAQGAANIVKLRDEIYSQAGAQGLDGKAIVNNFNEQAGALAGQRSIGTRAANISLAANEANNMIPIALDASAKVPRGEWMPWNKMVQSYQTGTSSPELARFVAATNSLVNSYVRAVSPSGVPTDSMREHAYSMLNSAQSPQAYQAVTSIMQDEMKAAMAAPGQVRKELRHEDGGAAPDASKPAVDQAAVEAEMKRRGLLK